MALKQTFIILIFTVLIFMGEGTAAFAQESRTEIQVDFPAVEVEFIPESENRNKESVLMESGEDMPSESKEILPVGPVVIDPVEAEESPVWCPRFYLQSNLAAWCMLISNGTFEIDLAPHWSFALPVYYSAWNYFRSDVKFRTLAVQPEVRYWFREERGFYVGAHLGGAYYNIAFGEKYRYQDKNGKTPAWGGGLSLGYRLPLSQNRNWAVNFAVGAGIYDVCYDRFLNAYDGKKTGSRHTTYIGVDNVSITFSYSFNLKRKARR